MTRTETESWWTIPNLITALRLLLILPFAGYARDGRDLSALAIFFVAGVSDALDGAVARWLDQRSRFGRLVDPVADKLLTAIAYIVLSLYRDSLAAIPVWVMAVVVSRDVLILLGCWIVYQIARDTGFRPTVFGKLNTLIELGVIAWFLAGAEWPDTRPALPALYFLMTVSIVFSFADYTRQGWRMIRASKEKRV